ncbi:hypothetical protein [Marinifilum sp.]|uniref:hypothetical protein n=1 Tax=Marinifilum sp. TaxID=2033137 RepID=UPI003BA9FCAE
MEENLTTIEMPKKRPTFLTVLCILSFIGSGYFGLIQPIYNYATFENTYAEKMQKTAEALEQMEEAGMESGFFYDMAANGMVQLKAMSENLEAITGANCLFALLSLIGVFLMFKLKKNGFYLYSFANVFWLLVPLALIDFDSMIMWTLIGAVITAIFIILYAVNLKHMN